MTVQPGTDPSASRYVVSVAGETHEVVVGPGTDVVIDGRRHEASLSGPGPTGMRTLFLDGRPGAVHATGLGHGLWELDLDGESVTVEVLDARTARVRALSGGEGSDRAAAALKAPMPGLVVKVAVKGGEVVEPGATLVIVEAMKMENELRAPVEARVERVLVAPGEAVEKGQVLVEFGEAEPQ